MKYAQLDPLSNAVTRIVDLTAEQVEALQGNPKLQWLRPFVEDQLPAVTAAQIAEPGGYLVEPAQVRWTWRVRDKTPDELQADAVRDELAALKETVTDALVADIAAGVSAPPTTLAQAAAHIQELKRRQQRADRILLWLLRSAQ